MQDTERYGQHYIYKVASICNDIISRYCTKLGNTRVSKDKLIKHLDFSKGITSFFYLRDPIYEVDKIC